MMHRQRGQTLLEFALVAIPFFFLVLGIIDIGRAVWHYNTVEFIASNIARQAETGNTISLARCAEVSLQACTLAPAAAGVGPHITIVSGACPRVDVTYPFQPAGIVTTPPILQAITFTATARIPTSTGVCPP